MQTFLPFADLRASSVVLDDRRLGKQRVETLQILRALTWPRYAWKSHPAVRMWRGFVPALVVYGRENCREWTRRGYADSVADQLLAWSGGVEPVDPPLPPWFGWEPVHRSHRAQLLRKEPQWYGDRFDVAELAGTEDGYVWPPDLFPAWPLRPVGTRPEDALRAAGLAEARHGQREALAAVAAGRDVLAVMRPSSGGTTLGVLAGLIRPGRTLIVAPELLPRAGPVPPVDGPPWRAVAPSVAVPPAARAPEPEDYEAMRAESGVPQFVFASPERLDQVGDSEGFGLVVVDRADELDDPQAARLAALRGRAAVAVIVGRADAHRRTELTERFHLRDPVHVGGGWDPGSVLEALAVDSPRARAAAVAAQAIGQQPVLVMCAGRDTAERRAKRLRADGIPATTWAPPPMRPARAEAALADFRARRTVLVVGAAALPPRGRGAVALLVGDDPPSLEAWREAVEATAARRSLLIVDPTSAADLRALVDTAGCLRAALLARFGEPVSMPCDRCGHCIPG